MIDENMFQKPSLHTITYILNWTKVKTPINCSPTPIPLLLYQHSTLSISSPPEKLYASNLIFFKCHISVTFVTHVIYLHHQKSDFYNYQVGGQPHNLHPLQPWFPDGRTKASSKLPPNLAGLLPRTSSRKDSPAKLSSFS